MFRQKIFITKSIPKEVENFIGKFCDYDKWDGEGQISRNELLEKLKDKDGALIATNIKVDEELLLNAPKLKVVSNIGVGYNNFDLEAMKKRRVIGTNTPGVLDDTVADLVFALILATARRVVELDKYIKNSKWKAAISEDFFGVDIHHSTLGIIGMGRIGEGIAKRAKLGFDMEVLYYNRSRKYEVEEKLGISYCDFESLLKKSDFIVIMAPSNKDTYHLIDTKEFNMMKDTAILINAARGEVVNEKALIHALKNKAILGAGLDVYEKEPIDFENPLLSMSNVVALPHVGSATVQTRFDMAMLAAKNLIKVLSGEVPPNIVSELR